MMFRSTGLSVVGQMLALSWQVERKAVITITALSVVLAAALALTGVAQRILIDGTQNSWPSKVVLAVLLGATAYTAMAAGNRVILNCQSILEKKLDLKLHSEILKITTTLPTLELLETPRFLDRLSLLRSNVKVLASSCWDVVATIRACFSILFVLAVLLEVSTGTLTLLVGAVAPLLAARAGERGLSRARTAQAENARHEQALHALTTDPTSATEIALVGAAGPVDEEAHAYHLQAARSIQRAQASAALTQFLGWTCYTTCYAVALIVVSRSVREGSASLGDLVLVISIGLRLTAELRAAVLGYTGIASALDIVSHYHWLRGVAQSAREHAPTAPVPEQVNELVLDDVTFIYPDSKDNVIDHLSLRIPRGSTIALIGENGSGKSTLVKLLSGMYRPSSGSIRINGVDASQLALEEWRSRVNVGYQDVAKFELPLREAVQIGGLGDSGDGGSSVWAALQRADARDLSDALPNGVDTQLGLTYGGVDLSGGQWQRVALARTLMRPDPVLLILDEPTSALDPEAEHRFYEVFQRETQRDGMITILVTHRLAAVCHADLIVVMAAGQVVEQGGHEDLMRLNGRYAHLYRLQSADHEASPAEDAASLNPFLTCDSPITSPMTATKETT